MTDKMLETRLPLRGEIADLLSECLISNPCVVAPGSSIRWTASVQRTPDGMRAYVASFEANWIDVEDDDESVLGAVDVALESDNIDLSEWINAEDTENEDGERDVACSGYCSLDDYMVLAWERHAEDSASHWAEQILDCHASRQRVRTNETCGIYG